MLDPARIMQRCDALARHSELAGGLTRVFLSREARAATDQVLGWMREAGMDARLAAITDICMLFVRCKGGISHSPLESITEQDAAAGARVLLDFIEHFELSA